MSRPPSGPFQAVGEGGSSEPLNTPIPQPTSLIQSEFQTIEKTACARSIIHLAAFRSAFPANLFHYRYACVAGLGFR